jgi:hypothetical protein
VSYAKVDGKNYDIASGLNPLNVEVSPDDDSASSPIWVADRTVR